eukprot:TRINITY_DN10809_c0_g1_i1.p1 TRINITY_DN10809_c0_g1~~TRINITY_DN10809_c0_g1_i1.p1  ORF type:complete len:187 (+),score=45.10 TRINITY_DN10809_c0_g1_i1:90-650(+)
MCIRDRAESKELMMGPGPCWGGIDDLSAEHFGSHAHVTGEDPTKLSTKIECIQGMDFFSFLTFGTSYTGDRCGMKAIVRVGQCKPGLVQSCKCTQGLANYDVRMSQLPDRLVSQLSSAKHTDTTPTELEHTTYNNNKLWSCDCMPGKCHGTRNVPCLLYTSDAADDLLCVDLGGSRIIKKKKERNI